MKKKYIVPALRMVELDTQDSLLVLSGNVGGDSKSTDVDDNGITGEGDILGREQNSIWSNSGFFGD